MLRSLSALLLLASGGVAAQSLPDMEDHQDALLVVPARTIQADVTGLYTSGQPNQTDVGLLARLGLGSGWELRAGVPGYTRTPIVSSFSDPTLGVKAELGTALGWTLAATGDASIPITSPDVQAVATLTAGRDLPASLAFEVVGELAYDTGDAPPTGAATPTGAVALVVAKRLLRQLDANVELAVGIDDLDLDSVILQNGYALLLSPAMQINAIVGVGLAGGGAPDALAGIGLSVRP